MPAKRGGKKLKEKIENFKKQKDEFPSGSKRKKMEIKPKDPNEPVYSCRFLPPNPLFHPLEARTKDFRIEEDISP